MRWYDRGELLHRQGDRAEAVYAIVDGAVKLSRFTPSGRATVNEFLGPGDLVGVRALLGEEAYLDDARMLEDALVAILPTGPAVRFLTAHPEAVVALARYLADRLKGQEDKVAALSTKRVHQRLVEGLLRLGHSLGVRSDGVVMINARITQAEIADWIGTTRETASTLLNELRRGGLIDIVSRRIHLLDPEGLCAYAECDELPPDVRASVEQGVDETEAPLVGSSV